MKRQPVQQEIMSNINPPGTAQLDLDQTSAQSPEHWSTPNGCAPGCPACATEPRALVYILQDAIGYAQDAKDSKLAAELQSMVDKIKAVEDFIGGDLEQTSDGECLDFILEQFGLEVR